MSNTSEFYGNGYKYQKTGRFKEGAPEVNVKGCLWGFLILVLVIGSIAGLAYIFGWE